MAVQNMQQIPHPMGTFILVLSAVEKCYNVCNHISEKQQHSISSKKDKGIVILLPTLTRQIKQEHKSTGHLKFNNQN